jgi:acyl carrier protein
MMTSRPAGEIEAVLRVLVAERLRIDPADVPMDVPIVAELGLESIEVMQFLLDVEDRFPPLNLTDAEFGQPRTLRELAQCVERFTNAT